MIHENSFIRRIADSPLITKGRRWVEAHPYVTAAILGYGALMVIANSSLNQPHNRNVNSSAFLNNVLTTQIQKKNYQKCQKIIRCGVRVSEGNLSSFNALQREVHLAFQKALHRGDLYRCKDWIQKGIDPNEVIDGSTLLNKALQEQNLTRSKLLIKLGAHPTDTEHHLLEDLTREYNGRLHEALNLGDYSLCQQWIAKGASPDALFNGETLLTTAIHEQNIQKCHFLIDNGATPSPLEWRDLEELWTRNEKDLPTFRILKSREDFLSLSELHLLLFLQRKLNAQLQEALRQDNFSLCYELVEQGADPNVRVAGETLLRKAIDANNLWKCKFIIDLGATLYPSEKYDLQELFARADVVTDFAKRVFMTKRPALGRPQVFVNGSFQYLDECSDACRQSLRLQGKPIYFLNIADEVVNSYYGAVSQVFTNCFNPFYEEMAKHFVLARVFVDRSEHFIRAVDKVQRLLPEIPFGHWALNGHGNYRCLILSPSQELTVSDGPGLRALGQELGPYVNLSFWSCCSKQLIAEWSKWLEGRMLFGSDLLVNEVIPQTFYSHVLQRQMFAPIFRQGQLREVKAYQEGRQLTVANLSNGEELSQEFIEAIEAHHASISPVIDGKRTRIYGSYF